jgi:hypothetical protein
MNEGDDPGSPLRKRLPRHAASSLEVLGAFLTLKQGRPYNTRSLSVDETL